MYDLLNKGINTHIVMKVTEEASMTKVLVTGGVGMLGSKVVKELTETGYSVRIMSRNTQFHYLVDLFFQAATKMPLVTLLPTDLQCQSIAESEVASRACEIVVAGPRGRLADLGGPEVLTTGEMLHSWLKLRGMHRHVLPLHLPGKVAQGFRRGYNTCPDQPVRGRITWTEWVQSKYEVQ